MPGPPAPRPLEGVVVLDATRMLPGAILARSLLDLGARLLKVEQPGIGDPMRRMPPLVGGVGLGFAACYRGAESVALDLRDPAGAAAFRHLAQHADVMVESFRPGTLARWGLDPSTLRQHNERLVAVSLPGTPPGSTLAGSSVGHDLNFVAASGMLAATRAAGVPAVQLADVTTGLLAASGVLAALLQRARSGVGSVFAQPMAAGPLPFLLWSWADRSRGATRSVPETLIGGEAAAYGVYRCADGLELAVACLEPKFWASFCARVGRPDLATHGLDPGPAGKACKEAMTAHLGGATRVDWLDRLAGQELPVSPVHGIDEARDEPLFASLLEATPAPGGGTFAAPGPFLPTLGHTPATPAPALGFHTAAVLREFGFDGP